MTKALMANIDTSVYAVFDTLAKKNKYTKKKMIEEMILFYQQHNERQAIIEAYQKMATDTEYIQEMRDNTLLLGY